MSGMKRLQAVALAVCLMLLGMIGISAAEVHAAVEDTFTAKIKYVPTGSPAQEQKINCTFKILKEPKNGGTGEVQVGDGMDIAIDESTSGRIEIPNEVINNNKTYIVTSIGESAFLGCTGLESTGLESNTSVTTVGVLAFSGCSGLISTGLESNKSVTNIGENAFSSCGGLESTGLESNKSVTTVGVLAFSGCRGLESTGLESNTSVTTVGMGAFYLCSSLEEVALSKDSKVATIGDLAFAYCANLQSFVIKGDKVPAFGSDVFSYTPSDFAIYYPVHVTNGSAAISTADAATGKQIDNSFTKGAKITITADAIEGKQFKNWSVDSGNVSLAGSESSSTTFLMPEDVVKVTANYENVEYTVTVDGGTGGGTYIMNDRVTITADQPPKGKRFKEWQVVSGKASLADPAKETTTFTMPAGNVEVKAVYENIPAGHKGETTPPGNGDNAKADTPQTSDPFNPGLLLLIMLAAGITAVVSWGTRKKKTQ